MNWNHLVKAGVSIVAVAACFSAQAASNGVTVSITPEKSSLNKEDDVVVRVTITNTSSTPQYILKWHTPFGGVEEALFDVKRDGVDVPYLGAHYKRPAPTAKDYYLLKPGASHTAKVELSALYDMSVTGDYSIKYTAASYQLFDGSKKAAAKQVAGDIDSIESAPASLWINGRLERGTVVGTPFELAKAPGGGGTPAPAGLSYTNCTASQQSTIASAVNTAKTMTNNGVSYLNAGTQGTRYTKWFGTYDSSRYATVKSHFAAIKDGFDNKPVVVDCSCKQSYYAYVYPTQPYKIYVCNAFWSAPLSGTDSKGGTMIHEMSHFNAVAGTDDWAYGQSAAASLAISNAAKAVDNADNHEYFGENTPALN
ncbi:M35 family metallo-endopeptidase [Massilia cavernae]|uniref:Peptidase M35 n=1 Tax=Massilia cavernae TaxID=2320864 RepID=A0A418Y493_9BURK|nr:M35 family metallo-endopeptidase [Massilia cavernae]RJG20407.1 peptidase M35 [Massilia cavernae]